MTVMGQDIMTCVCSMNELCMLLHWLTDNHECDSLCTKRKYYNHKSVMHFM